MNNAATAMTATQAANDDEVAILDPSQVIPAPWGNMRTSPRNPSSFARFKADVELRGIIQPVVVRPHPSIPGRYELLAGYGRWEAALEFKLGLPALIKQVTDAEGQAIGVMENLQREDPNPVDEALSAVKIVATCGGSLEDACLVLGWRMQHLKQRLHIARCAKPVLDAVVIPAANGFTLPLRHADLLAGISEEAQLKLLPTIIEKQMSFETLKDLLGRATISLSKARFDTGECATCLHNSQLQTPLFSEFNDDAAQCRNRVCFNAKTTAMVDATRADLEERFGKVILYTEVDQSLIPIVTHENVGAEQFYNGCLTCQSRAVLLDDRADTAGDVHENRCADQSCFKNCVSKHQAASTQEQEPEQPSTNKTPENAAKEPKRGSAKEAGKQGQATANASKQKSSGSEVSTNLSAKAVVDNKQLLRKASYDAWGSDQGSAQHFQIAVLLASLRHVQGKSFGTELPKILGSMSDDEIRKAIIASQLAIATEQESVGYTTMNDVMISTLKYAPNAKQHAVACWIPTAERLGLYTKPAIIHMLDESGFKDAFIAAQADAGDKAYKQLCSERNSDLIAAVLAFNFDWSHYAPAAYLKGL